MIYFVAVCLLGFGGLVAWERLQFRCVANLKTFLVAVFTVMASFVWLAFTCGRRS